MRFGGRTKSSLNASQPWNNLTYLVIFSLRQSADKNGTDGTNRVVLQPDRITSAMASILREWETLVFWVPALGGKSVPYDEGYYFRYKDGNVLTYSRPIKKLAFPVRLTTASLPLTQVQLSAAVAM